MTDRPILFSAPMVRALLDGRKTQTRRVIKERSDPWSAWQLLESSEFTPEYVADPGNHLCPYGVPGDVLWVREAFTRVPSSAYRMSEGVQQTVNPSDPDEAAIYAAGWDRSIPKWKPSIHMPRWASRLSLRITDVRVQRLNDCSEADALAEGMSFPEGLRWGNNPIAAYAGLWDSINGKTKPDKSDVSWAANPWVWAVSFEVVK